MFGSFGELTGCYFPGVILSSMQEINNPLNWFNIVDTHWPVIVNRWGGERGEGRGRILGGGNHMVVSQGEQQEINRWKESLNGAQ